MPPADPTDATLITNDGGIVSLVLVDVEAIAETYIMQMERCDFVRSIAAGEPASFAYMKTRLRRFVTA